MKCKVAKLKSKKSRIKTAAATIATDMTAELSKQLKYQQQQIGNFKGQMKTLVTIF